MEILLRMSEIWVVWEFDGENVFVCVVWMKWIVFFFLLMINEVASKNGKQTTKMNENYDAFLFFVFCGNKHDYEQQWIEGGKMVICDQQQNLICLLCLMR